MDVVAGAIEVGVKNVSAYAFSTENWRRSPDEVRFLMGFNRDVIRRRVDELNSWGVRVLWTGRKPRLWRSVVRELQRAEDITANNTVCTLQMCVNYGGRAELVDATRAIAADVATGKINPKKITAETIEAYLYQPQIPDVDLFVRSSGEQRTSNFLLWQSAYAEMVFLDRLWPDFDRRDLWEAIDTFARRDRRYGGAVDAVGSPSENRVTDSSSSHGESTAAAQPGSPTQASPSYNPQLMADPDEADGGVFPDDGLID